MGISAQLMPGGDCVVARMRLQRRIFETATTPIIIEDVTFATVGPDGAKCMRPRALFQLPILHILDCRDATALEARIHLAWQRHSVLLTKTQAWLRGRGATCSTDGDRSVVKFPLPGQDARSFGRMIDPNSVILPSRGALSEMTLRRVDDRILRVDPTIDQHDDLLMRIGARLDQLTQLDRRLSDAPAPKATEESSPRIFLPSTPHRADVLLVGQRVGQERECIEALRMRGFRVETALGQRAAIAAFDRCSPELVLADVQLDRAEGIELIQSLRKVPGIEEVPVVLIDERRRPERRDVARRIGAAGYLVYPLDVKEIAARLERIVTEPRRRRFTRYNERLAVSVAGQPGALVTTAIGRGGMFLATDEDLPTNTIHECRLALPGTAAGVRVAGEILYRARTFESARDALGVRFRSFAEADEPLLIEYLKNLQPAPVSPTF